MLFPARAGFVDLTSDDDDVDMLCIDRRLPPPAKRPRHSPARRRPTEHPCQSGGACSSRCRHLSLGSQPGLRAVVVELEDQPNPSSPEAPDVPNFLWVPPKELTVLDTELQGLRDRCPCAGCISTTSGLIVRMPIETGQVGGMRSRAWGITTSQPIVVEVVLPPDGGPPTVSVYQCNDPDLNRPAVAHRTDALGLMQYFLQSRAERRLRELWEAAVSEVAAGCNTAAGPRADGTPAMFRGGTLGEVFSYLDFRFNTASSHCIMCDCDLEITTVSLTVCDAAPCQAFYRTASCGSLVTSALRHSPQVVDLLLNLLMAACQRNNGKSYGVPLPDAQGTAIANAAQQNFLPPPSVNTPPLVQGSQWQRSLVTNYQQAYWQRQAAAYNYQQPATYWQQRRTCLPLPFEPFPYGIGVDKDRQQDVQLLVDTCDKLPPLMSLQCHRDDAGLKAALDNIDPLLFPLLKWVICSTRMFLSHVPEADCLKEMYTPYQFKVLASNPEHERAFQGWCAQARQQTGARTSRTYFGFHGSPISNWHSVLRAGLRCSPNGMLGPGVYAHETAAYSQHFMQTSLPGGVWRNSMFQPNGSLMSVMALVEIADLRLDRRRINTGGGESAITDYTMVALRYLFFYPQGLNTQLSALASRLHVNLDPLADADRTSPPSKWQKHSVPRESRDSPETNQLQILNAQGMLDGATCTQLRAFMRANNLGGKGARKEQLLQVVRDYLASRSPD